MSYKDKKFISSIPKGLQNYISETEIHGLFNNLNNVKEFFNGTDQLLILKREPNNTHDGNAIEVYGKVIKKSLLFFSSEKQYKLGYISKEIAEDIEKYNLISKITTRLKYIGIGDEGEKITLGLKRNIKRFKTK